MKVNLNDVCKEIFAGGDVPKDRFSEKLTKEYKIPIYANAEKNNGLYGYTNKARVFEPAVTIAARGTIGFCAKRYEPFLPVVRLITAIPNKDKISVEYLYYLLRKLSPKGSGTSIPQLTVPDVKRYSFDLIELEKQTKTVNILDNISNIINLRQQQLEQLNTLIKARFVEMFGNIQKAEKYSAIMLREISKTISGGTPSTKNPDYYNGSIPWVTTTSLGPNYIDGSTAKAFITESAIEHSATKLIQAGNILFGTRVGVGKSSINTVDICTNQDIVAIVNLDEANYNKLFIKYVLDSYQDYFDSIKKGATILGITSEDLKNVLVPVVSIELQNEFAEFVEQVDKSKVVVKKALDEAQLLFDSLMQEYFG